jgi:hypothetical protein
MRVQLVGPNSGYTPSGYQSWAADEVVEVDDGDQAAVDWYRAHCAGGGGVILEEEKPPALPEPPEPTLADLRAQAEAQGLPTYGTKAQLQERLDAATED